MRKIDPSFAPQAAGHFTAVNADGLMVDLITPEPKQRMKASLARMRRLGAQLQDLTTVEDVEAVEVPRLEMTVDAPRFSAIAVADDGLPVWISAADPRWWAAHKLWLGYEPKREAIKRQRDRSQGAGRCTDACRAFERVGPLRRHSRLHPHEAAGESAPRG